MENNGILFYCEEENSQCEKIENIGYYVNADGSSFECKIVEQSLLCSKYTLGFDCETETIGKLYKNGDDISLCLRKNDKIKAYENLRENAKDCIVSYGQNNIYGINSNEFTILSINENSAFLDLKKYKNTLYAYTLESNFKVIDIDNEQCPTNSKGSIDENTLIEYICTEGKCKMMDDIDVDAKYIQPGKEQTIQTSTTTETQKLTSTTKTRDQTSTIK